jgi:hypothetical protein
MIRFTTRLLALALLCCATQSLQAAIRLNEIFVNPPSTDNGIEFIELRSTSGGAESMSGLSLIVIEGDGTSAGIVDMVLNLNSFSTGSNGLFLWRDAATVLDTSTAPGVQGPSLGTNLNVADFAPDIENGTNTYMIVSGLSSITVGVTDLDTDNDGIFDVTPWTSIVDALGFIENDGAQNIAYADDIGYPTFGPFAGFNADVLIKMNDKWLGADILGTPASPGPYPLDSARFGYSDGSTHAFSTILPEAVATPGAINPVPEPSTYAVLALLGVGIAYYRKRS